MFDALFYMLNKFVYSFEILQVFMDIDNLVDRNRLSLEYPPGFFHSQVSEHPKTNNPHLS